MRDITWLDFELRSPQASGSDRITLCISPAGVAWQGMRLDGPTAGGFSVGPPQSLEDFLERPHLPLPEPLLTEARSCCLALLVQPPGMRVPSWTQAQIAERLRLPESLDQHDAEGQTALTQSIRKRWTSELGAILEAGADPARPQRGPAASPPRSSSPAIASVTRPWRRSWSERRCVSSC